MNDVFVIVGREHGFSHVGAYACASTREIAKAIVKKDVEDGILKTDPEPMITRQHVTSTMEVV